MGLNHRQIGEVAEHTGLSLRAILDETRKLLTAVDHLEIPATPPSDRNALLEQSATIHLAVAGRRVSLRDQLASAEGFATSLRREICRRQRAASGTR